MPNYQFWQRDSWQLQKKVIKRIVT